VRERESIHIIEESTVLEPETAMKTGADSETGMHERQREREGHKYLR